MTGRHATGCGTSTVGAAIDRVSYGIGTGATLDAGLGGTGRGVGEMVGGSVTAG